jgi:hypothetical protein
MDDPPVDWSHHHFILHFINSGRGTGNGVAKDLAPQNFPLGMPNKMLLWPLGPFLLAAGAVPRNERYSLINFSYLGSLKKVHILLFFRSV